MPNQHSTQELWEIITDALGLGIGPYADNPDEETWCEALAARDGLIEQLETFQSDYDALSDSRDRIAEQYEGMQRDLWETARERDGLKEQFDSIAEAVEALWVTRIVTGETAVVNTRELADLHKLFRASNPAKGHPMLGVSEMHTDSFQDMRLAGRSEPGGESKGILETPAATEQGASPDASSTGKEPK